MRGSAAAAAGTAIAIYISAAVISAAAISRAVSSISRTRMLTGTANIYIKIRSFGQSERHSRITSVSSAAISISRVGPSTALSSPQFDFICTSRQSHLIFAVGPRPISIIIKSAARSRSRSLRNKLKIYNIAFSDSTILYIRNKIYGFPPFGLCVERGDGRSLHSTVLHIIRGGSPRRVEAQDTRHDECCRNYYTYRKYQELFCRSRLRCVIIRFFLHTVTSRYLDFVHNLFIFVCIYIIMLTLCSYFVKSFSAFFRSTYRTNRVVCSIYRICTTFRRASKREISPKVRQSRRFGAAYATDICRKVRKKH